MLPPHREPGAQRVPGGGREFHILWRHGPEATWPFPSVMRELVLADLCHAKFSGAGTGLAATAPPGLHVRSQKAAGQTPHPRPVHRHEKEPDAPERHFMKGSFHWLTHVHDSITTCPLFSEKKGPLWAVNSPARCGNACGSLPGTPRVPHSCTNSRPSSCD